MKKLIYLFVMAIMAGGCATATIIENGKSVNPIGQTYYTKANIWYEKPSVIISLNLHIGNILPLGTEVKIVSCSGNTIRFTNDGGVTFSLINASRYSDISLETLFGEYFSRNNITADGGDFSKLTNEEQESIKRGVITEGMSKEAVLMSWGYPPSHKTPSLSGNIWRYWVGGSGDRIVVYFYNNAVVSEEDYKELKGRGFGFVKPGATRQNFYQDLNECESQNAPKWSVKVGFFNYAGDAQEGYHDKRVNQCMCARGWEISKNKDAFRK